jgi:hypothetical protein
MIIKKEFYIIKPYDVCKMTYNYWYSTMKIKVIGFYLFGLIPIYKKQETIEINRGLESYVQPKIIIYK